MAKEDNLRPPFPPGVSGNPNGRPKGSKNRTTIIKEMIEAAALKTYKLNLESDPDFQPGTIADQIAAALVLKALTGDVTAMREVLDSAYGKLVERSEVGHTFAQMGKIEVGSPGADRSALSFDVGSEPSSEPDGDEE